MISLKVMVKDTVRESTHDEIYLDLYVERIHETGSLKRGVGYEEMSYCVGPV